MAPRQSHWPRLAREIGAHQRFCQIEGWIEVTSATGFPVRHHQTFELVLNDGSILRTRISRPVDRTSYSRSMWSHILRYQLAVSADEVWACVQQNGVPTRFADAEPPTRRSCWQLRQSRAAALHGPGVWQVPGPTPQNCLSCQHARQPAEPRLASLATWMTMRNSEPRSPRSSTS